MFSVVFHLPLELTVLKEGNIILIHQIKLAKQIIFPNLFIQFLNI